ncbi:serine acetyltransferase [Nitzschia inconspicua]|uniref:serine O-acetyltransferase n=1 Tax=Nitzschia inconspicua TaxID=303405 RepID=A0A9K3M2Y2_9STRA|nr:serine acetyltransferase [Nitzschia inconspicua]
MSLLSKRRWIQTISSVVITAGFSSSWSLAWTVAPQSTVTRTTALYFSDLTSSKFAIDDELKRILQKDPQMARQLYISPVLWETNDEWKFFMLSLRSQHNACHLWEQVRLEATASLEQEPGAGPQLYQNILSQPSLIEAIVTIVANEIETELVMATEIKKLFLDVLTAEDEETIRCDAIAAATRSPSVECAMLAVLFHTGYHALVCYRVGHRLWQQGRTGLAYYLQSTVSRNYSADIHPACRMGQGIYLCSGAGVVIGETATIGNDVSILHGVTLGGTGKETGDRHPKVQDGVILEDSATVLGNIPVGFGAIVKSKAIVNKPVPPLAIVSGVPAKIIASRNLSDDSFQTDLDRHLAFKYIYEWKARKKEMDSEQKKES